MNLRLVPPVSLDPFENLARTPEPDRRRLGGPLLVAAGAHAAVALGVPRLLPPVLVLSDLSTQVVDIDVPAPPVPRPMAPPPVATAPEDNPGRRDALTHAPAARAAQVLTRRVDPDEPVDLTAGFVTGSASTYAGGLTAAGGSEAGESRHADAHAGLPVVAPVSTAGRKGGAADRSRRASLVGGAQWTCPFPREADHDQVDQAVVAIRVDLDASGAVKRALVLDDPGHGFGREAQRCASSKPWRPALDHDGSPTEGSVTVHVRFER